MLQGSVASHIFMSALYYKRKMIQEYSDYHWLSTNNWMVTNNNINNNNGNDNDNSNNNNNSFYFIN